MGILSDSRYERGSLIVKPGDLLVLYTDGLVEAEDPAGEEFSVGRLEEVVRSSAHLPVQGILELIHAAVVQFHGDPQLQDDMTVVVLKVTHKAG